MPIQNPKRSSLDRTGYPYYAGFSTAFVESTLTAWRLPLNAVVLDPWNGSGTTTAVASGLGYSSIGLDLNPAAVTLARARLLNPAATAGLSSSSKQLVEEASRMRGHPYGAREPLLHWFDPVTARRIRRFEVAIQRVLVDHDGYRTWSVAGGVDELPPVASFYLTTLFLLVRNLLSATKGSNPTWIRGLRNGDRLSATFNRISSLFGHASRTLADHVCRPRSHNAPSDIRTGDSRCIPMRGGSVDAVISSPPYCTRLDYVVATRPELAVLGFHPEINAPALRRQMLGTPITTGIDTPAPDATWGNTCLATLRNIRAHTSKASKTYYSRFYSQYFAGLRASLLDIDRVCRRTARIALVVQDSYYKDVPVRLGEIVTEMGTLQGWHLSETKSFPVKTPLVRINSKARHHLPTRSLSEHALFFELAS